jgi:hypothetical protein
MLNTPRPAPAFVFIIFAGFVLSSTTSIAQSLPQALSRSNDQQGRFDDEPVLLSRAANRTVASMAAPSAKVNLMSTDQAGDFTVSLDVESNGELTLLDALITDHGRNVTWTGNGGVLTEVSRQAIARLEMELQAVMQQPSVSRHEEWAFRLATLWSEAPLGVPLESRRIYRDSVEDRPGRELDKSPAARGEGRNVTATATKPSCPAGCNVNGGEGIKYLRGSSKDSGCQSATYATQHDACVISTGKGHCYTTYYVTAGCNRNSGCPGRCGAGCGLNGFGVYSKDCLDHDYCVGHDGASACCEGDAKCGDEFTEAEDDYLFGTFNCNGCK